MTTKLCREISTLTHTIREFGEQRKIEFEWLKSHSGLATKQDLRVMELIITMKLSEVKAAISLAASQNREAFTELSGKIADLQKQIDDLISGAGDPEITDEAFLADLESLKNDAAALADIVPNPVEPPPE